MFLFTLSWLLILGGAVVVFNLIIPFHFCGSVICNGLAKGVSSTTLAFLWLGAMLGMRNAFVKGRILKARIDFEEPTGDLESK